MATNRITYGQSAIAVSQPPANSDNTSNLTGLKRVQSASINFAFARERFKQIGSPDYVGQVQVKNADIGLDIDYFYVPKITDWQVNIFSILGLNLNIFRFRFQDFENCRFRIREIRRIFRKIFQI